MTLYEVNIDVHPHVSAAFDAWLPGHIDELLALPGFIDAQVFTRPVLTDGEHAGWQRRTVHYRLRTAADLERYLSEHAPQQRAEAISRFGAQVHYERRVFEFAYRRG
jgi:hypothetical protein